MKDLSKKRLLKYLFQVLLLVAGFLACYETSLKRKMVEPAFPYLEIDKEVLQEPGLLTEKLASLDRELEPFGASSVALVSSYCTGYQKWDFYGEKEAAARCLSAYGFHEGWIKGALGTNLHITVSKKESDLTINHNTRIRLLFVSEGNVRMDIPARDVIRIFGQDPAGKRVQYAEINRKNYGMIFFWVFLLLLFFEGYQMIYEARECVLRFLHGEQAGTIMLVKMAGDVGVTILVWMAGLWIGKNLYQEVFPWQVFFLPFAGYFLLDLLMGMGIFAVEWKKNLAKQKKSAGLLAVSCFFRGWLLMAYVLLLSYMMQGISDYIKVSSHDGFYRYFKEWSQGVGTNGDLVYTELLKEDRAALISWQGTLPKAEVIQINERVYDYLLRINAGMPKKSSFTSEVVILYPENRMEALTEEEQGQLLTGLVFEGATAADRPYKGRITLPLLRGSLIPEISDWAENPVLVLDFRKDLTEYKARMYEEVEFVWSGSFFLLPSGEESAFGSLHTPEGRMYHFQNIYDIYQETILPYKTILQYCLIALIVAGILEILLLIRITGLEFRMNLMKYLNARLLGGGFISVYGGMFFVTVLLNAAAGLVAGIVLSEKLSKSSCLTAVLAIVAFECFIQILYVKKLEKSSFPKLLKGAIL